MDRVILIITIAIAMVLSIESASKQTSSKQEIERALSAWSESSGYLTTDVKFNLLHPQHREGIEKQFALGRAEEPSLE